MPDPDTTRRSLHAVAELLLAGPQFAQSGTIKLRPTAAGFGTVASPDVRIEGTDLVVGDRTVALHGRAIADVAEEAGLQVRRLDDVYSDGAGLTAAHVLHVDAARAADIAEAFRAGDEALAALAPDVERVLWPEHFDLGFSLDEANYGVCAGDAFLTEPYAYVGPWSPADFTGAFWNAPFGAALPLAEIPDLTAFFAAGRDLTTKD